MKRQVVLVFLLCGVILAGCSKLKPAFRKLAAAEVDANQKAVAEQVATKLLEGWRAGKFEALGEEATLSMRKTFTAELQKSSYQEITGLFGEFKSMQYVESWAPNDGTLSVIHRFKASFAKSPATPEIRVVLDGNGKLSGLWLKPWEDKLR
ncbi:MAG: hypothetical protein PHV34_10015 [Verrucomicrobiae bacterium]|nr:hypothetical protein [Verrucomicrobiae bacterium]